MFTQLSSIPDLADQEKKLIDYWNSLNIVELLKSERKDMPEKVYYDGPITANNMPHYGHVITWTMKDIVPRYWSMKGYFVSRNMGWDCQGIPVEYEVEKELGFKEKKDIEKYGVEKFNQLCKQSVFKYRDSIFNYETRVGRWFDDKDVYYTMDKNFIESMWWSLSELYKKGLLYEGYKVVAYSTRAGSTLSTHEVNDGGYKDIEDPYVTVKFQVLDNPKLGDNTVLTENTYFLAWTTTPWTIPGNLLLAVGKNIDYVLVESKKNQYILAKEMLEDVFKDRDYNVILDTIKGRDLENLKYKPPFNYFEHKREEGCFVVVVASHANTDEGTGIVHLAPYGAEDFEVFRIRNIEIFDYLDDSANFTEMIPEYAGQFYKQANEKLISDLQKKEKLFDSGKLVHRMPMCWRTDTPLIYKPIKSWYIAVTKIKEKMLEENQKVNWLPEHLKDGNSGIWISNVRYWALSRKRYWGTPLPVWINDKTGEKVVIGSFAELKEKSGVEIEDPHKPYVDGITWEDTVNGGVYRRIPDVIDVWYDSGSVPFAKLHYPFENEERFKQTIPAEYISEGLDQVRLWFYVMHVLGVALFDMVPYQNVVTTGIMLSKDGEKLSKRKKNFPPMDYVLDTYGADVLRLFILTSPIVQGESARFYEEALVDIKREFFLPLWNSMKYFFTYAEANNFSPTLNKPEPAHLLDKWILLRLSETQNKFNENMDRYYIMDASRVLSPFVTDLSTWYVRRSRDRIKGGDEESILTLYYVLSEFCKLIAPMTPFMADTMFELLKLRELTGKQSVHLCLLPEQAVLNTNDDSLLMNMKNTRNIVSLALSIRMSEGIKVRQPLSNLYIEMKNEENKKYYEDLIKEEVNVKEIKELADVEKSQLKAAENSDFVVYLDTTITKELELEGRSREFIRSVQDLRKSKGINISELVDIEYVNSEELKELLTVYGDHIKKKAGVKEFIAGSELKITG